MGRVVAPDQPQWLPEDTDLALEWQAEHDVTHAACGQPLDESTDPANETRYRAHPIVCFACAEKERDREEYAGDKHGLMFIVTRAQDGED